ncbi:MAG: helix-turn-helix domain-containing protein [Clostridiales bacterium]|jgi:transcriptional regulator with XRE-family HTH domain|nr:helix-turn-helix domain-containing protein [Clostridiales bacterium]
MRLSALGNKAIFSKNLKYYIEQSGKDRRELANIWGFPYSTVTEWVNGKKYPRIDRIEIMADYFGIQKSDLIEEKPPEEQQKKPDADDGLSDNMRELMDFVRTVPEDKAAMILSVIRTIVESGK